jgi:hypothetical protein
MSKNLAVNFMAGSAAISLFVVAAYAPPSFAAPSKKLVTPTKIAQSKTKEETATKQTDDKGGAQMSGKQAAALISSPGLKSFSKKADVPAAVADLIPGFKSMAEPGGDFAAGCVGPGPHTRMILAATQGNKVIVAHESGGIAHWYKVEIFEQTGKGAVRVFSAFVSSPFENLATLQEAVKKGALQSV